MKFKILNLIGLVIISTQLLAQNFSVKEDLSFRQNGVMVENPYAGGLKSVQISQLDINGDGVLDLFVFDRASDSVYPFIRQSGGEEAFYKHEPIYSFDFPRFFSWVILKDFDGDGVEDIFCSPTDEGIAGIRVYKGSREDGRLSFDLLEFPNFHNDVLWFENFNSKLQIYVANTDIPGIIDVDGDTDLDILSFDSGGSYVSYFQNQSIESGYGRDSLIFTLKDACFGKFLESVFSEELFLSNDPLICSQGFTDNDEESVSVRHAGSSISPIDLNQDGMVDLLLGDLAYDGLVLLMNGGTIDNAWMNSQVSGFPDYDTPVQIDIFNAAFFPDVDLDGKNDMVVSINQRNTGQNKENIWLYKNVSTGDNQLFELQSKEFLKERALLLGARVSPKFVDYNQDGLLDIVAASQGFFGAVDPVIPRLYLFENEGTPDYPVFNLVDDDYLGLSEFSTTSALFSPAFGDLDGDLDIDLVIGDESGDMYYLENIAGEGQEFQFASAIFKYQDIRVGSIVNPYIFDFNEDGLGDLFIGERNKAQDGDGNIGVLNYLVNQGEVGEPLFTPVSMAPNTQVFGKINLTKYTALVSSSPSIYDTGDGILVFIGTEDGEIHVYEGETGDPLVEFQEVTDNLGNIHVGRQTVMDVADIDNDGYLEIAIGSINGSFFIYNTTIQTNGTISSTAEVYQTELTVYPNPANDVIYFSLPGQLIKKINIYNLAGKIVYSGGLNEYALDISGLTAGLYIGEFISEKGISGKLKFLKL